MKEQNDTSKRNTSKLSRFLCGIITYYKDNTQGVKDSV